MNDINDVNNTPAEPKQPSTSKPDTNEMILHPTITNGQPPTNTNIDTSPNNKDKDQDKSTPPASAPEPGTILSVSKLWETTSPQTRRITWATEPPPQEETPTSAEESPQYVITLLHRPAKDTGRHRLDAIVLRGSTLRRFLEATIPNISSLYNEAEHGILIRAPFRSLFWHLDQIEAAAASAASDNPDETLRSATSLLRDVLHTEFHSLLTKRNEMVSNAEINFHVCWTLFKPGITCLTSYMDDTIAVRVTTIEYSKDPMGLMYYRVGYRVLAWNGEDLGWVDSYADVMEFPGRRRIRELDVYPVEFHGGYQGLVEGLVGRGRRYVDLVLREPCMMSFSGSILDREASPMWWQADQKKMMSERVVLDARGYNHYYRRLSTVTRWKKREDLQTHLTDPTFDASIFMFCRPELHCFALQHKQWARVWLDDLQPVTFNDAAYPSLVLPNDYKDLLLAFAEAQIDEVGFDDVIAGKGQGILMLLAGSPGTGKTLTAEAVAEHMKCPLYAVSAGELGATPGGMEHALDRVLELSTRWNAVLLLDEADVFLERRTDNDLHRNSIVSVFLRKLEYYRGIMFLTTNRFGSFDEAFKSRIHIAIQYPDLDAPARKTVWENFLAKARDTYRFGVDVGSDEIEVLSQLALNGREIRNIVKSAQLLASRGKVAVQKKHLDIVWRVEHKDSVWSPSR